MCVCVKERKISIQETNVAQREFSDIMKKRTDDGTKRSRSKEEKDEEKYAENYQFGNCSCVSNYQFSIFFLSPSIRIGYV